MLDLSAETIDHTILLRRLDDWFGVTGKAYLTGRCQRIRLGDCLSSKADLKFGVPQGSVLGPLLFTLYTTPSSSMISGHAIPHHLYTDDSQLYVSFASGGGGAAAALNGLQSCLASVQSWMLTNKLKLNPIKTEFLLIGKERQRSKYLLLSFSVSKLTPLSLLGILEQFLTKIFTFRSHISAVCSSCFYRMWDLWRIRRHLDLDSAKLLATDLVSSHLNHCNSLLYVIADIDLAGLQHVQNRLARLVTKSPPFACSLPLLRSLHWLPVRFKILVKNNLLIYKTREKQPVYLHSMLAASLSSCPLGSNNDNSLSVPRPTQVQELFTLMHLSGTTSRCLSVQPFQLLPSRNI